MKKKNKILAILIFFFLIFFILIGYHNQSTYNSIETRINLDKSESPIIFIGGFPRSGTTLIVMFISYSLTNSKI